MSYIPALLAPTGKALPVFYFDITPDIILVYFPKTQADILKFYALISIVIKFVVFIEV